MKYIFVFTFLISQHLIATDAIFSKISPNEAVCYGREYSAEHLRNQPNQTVQKIQSKFEIYDSEESKTRIMQLEVTLKGKKNTYTNYRAFFVCNDNNNICSVECDGGRVEAELTKDGNILIINKGFIIKGECGNEGDIKMLEPTLNGDEFFELVPLPKQFCEKTSDI